MADDVAGVPIMGELEEADGYPMILHGEGASGLEPWLTMREERLPDGRPYVDFGVLADESSMTVIRLFAMNPNAALELATDLAALARRLGGKLGTGTEG